MSDRLADSDDFRRVVRADRIHDGRIFDIVGDTVELSPGTEPVRREYMVHPGAVAIVALRGEPGAEQVLLVRQYRHASRAQMFEIPAGLLDVPGEDPVEAGRRELFEEADLVADSWHVLADTLLSPGATNECVRVLLARDLSEVPDAERHEREDEEAEMISTWVPLDDAVRAVLAGDLHNGATSIGLLAAAASRSRGYADLRGPDAPWTLRRYRAAEGAPTE
ncbi:MAG: NUDIX domain-containing protein [Actinomycetaceae bacterium]